MKKDWKTVVGVLYLFFATTAQASTCPDAESIRVTAQAEVRQIQTGTRLHGIGYDGVAVVVKETYGFLQANIGTVDIDDSKGDRKDGWSIAPNFSEVTLIENPKAGIECRYLFSDRGDYHHVIDANFTEPEGLGLGETAKGIGMGAAGKAIRPESGEKK